MLITRLFHPADGDILYHYCSVSAFHAILESGRIRFTDINMLNDRDEMRWGYSVFEEAAGNLLTLARTKETLRGCFEIGCQARNASSNALASFRSSVSKPLRPHFARWEPQLALV